MDSKKTGFVYVVRELTLGQFTCDIRVDSEAIFTSFEKAKKHLDSLADSEINESLIYRLEILAIPLDIEDPYDETKQWLYDYNGKLLYCTGDNQQDRYQSPPKGIFQPGDIVYIKPNHHESVSPSVKGDFGVVAVVPVRVGEGARRGNDPEDWDITYVIYYITDKGIVDHWHMLEPAMEIFSGELPRELCFLNYLSRHFKGENSLSDDFLKSALNGMTYVKNTKTLDLSDLDNPRIRNEVEC